MANQPRTDPPHGMEPYDLGGPDDLGALSAEQQEKLNQFKKDSRSKNEQYLRNHPEVECLMTGFLGDVLIQRPDNIRHFAGKYFTNPSLPDKLHSELEERKEDIRRNKVLRKM